MRPESGRNRVKDLLLAMRVDPAYPNRVKRIVFPSRPRPYWRATLRSAALVELVLLDRWHQEVRVFRWRFLARAAAFRYRRSARGRIMQCRIEPYRPGDNIVALPAGPRGQA